MVEGAYQDAWSADIPLENCSGEIDLKITVGKQGGKRTTYFNRKFSITPGVNYSCEVYGSSVGFKARFCEGDIVDESSPKLSGSASGIVTLSFAFPIYGIYKAITDKYFRNKALAGAAAGFFFALIMSAMASDGDKIGFGLGHATLFEYEPFSLTDLIINLLIGGIASIRGLLYALFS